MRVTMIRGTVILLALTVAVAWPPTASASTRSQILYARGLVPFEQGNWQAAYQLFDEAVRADPNDAVARYYRGVAAARLAQWNLAAQDIERAAELRPDLPRVALDLGIIYFELQQFERAQQSLERAYRQPRDRFAAALFLGVTAYRMGREDEALRYFADAEKDPKLRPTARYYSALVQLQRSDTEQGRAMLAELSRAHPETQVGRIAGQYVTAEAAVPEPQRERRWSLYGTAGFEYDSNVVLAPDDEAVQESRRISDESDVRLRLGFGGGYRLWDGGLISAIAGYDFHQSIHLDLTEFDLQGHRLRLDLATPWRPFQLGITGMYDFYALDYRTFLQQALGSPWLAFHEDEWNATRVFYALRGRDYFREPFDPFLDSVNHAVGIEHLLLFGERGRARAAYQFDDNDPPSRNGNDFQYQGHQLGLEAELPLGGIADAIFGYVFRLEDYDLPNSRSPEGFRRHDHAHQLATRLQRQLIGRWYANVTYLGVFHGSNLPEFEYDRHVFGVGAEYRY